MRPFIRALLLLSLLAGPLFGTVTETSSTVSTACNNSTVDFSFDFPIIATTDLVVILRTVADGTEEVLTETTDYTVSAVNNDYSSGGTVTTVSTYSSDYTLTVLRDTPDTQNADLVDSDTSALRIADLEEALDKLTLLVQQLQEELNRSIKVPRSDSGITVMLDDSVTRASKYLMADSDGHITASTTVASGSVSASAFMQTVLDDADADAAKTTLSIPTIATFMESVLDDTDAATARTTLGAAGLTGNETIAGNKTLTGTTILSGVTTIADASVMASSAAPTTDAMIPNKKYVDDLHKPYARMYLTAAQNNLTDVTWATVTLDTDEFDSGTITDLANYKITPAVAGQYLVIGQITYTNVIAEKTYYAQLWFNGASAKTQASAATGAATEDISVRVCDVVVFDNNDYIQLRAYVNTGAATVDLNPGTADTYLVLYRL